MKHKNIYIEIQSDYQCIIIQLKKIQFIIRHGKNSQKIQINNNNFYLIYSSFFVRNNNFQFSGMFY